MPASSAAFSAAILAASRSSCAQRSLPAFNVEFNCSLCLTTALSSSRRSLSACRQTRLHDMRTTRNAKKMLRTSNERPPAPDADALPASCILLTGTINACSSKWSERVRPLLRLACMRFQGQPRALEGLLHEPAAVRRTYNYPQPAYKARDLSGNLRTSSDRKGFPYEAQIGLGWVRDRAIQ